MGQTNTTMHNLLNSPSPRSYNDWILTCHIREDMGYLSDMYPNREAVGGAGSQKYMILVLVIVRDSSIYHFHVKVYSFWASWTCYLYTNLLQLAMRNGLILVHHSAACCEMLKTERPQVWVLDLLFHFWSIEIVFGFKFSIIKCFGTINLKLQHTHVR